MELRKRKSKIFISLAMCLAVVFSTTAFAFAGGSDLENYVSDNSSVVISKSETNTYASVVDNTFAVRMGSTSRSSENAVLRFNGVGTGSIIADFTITWCDGITNHYYVDSVSLNPSLSYIIWRNDLNGGVDDYNKGGVAIEKRNDGNDLSITLTVYGRQYNTNAANPLSITFDELTINGVEIVNSFDDTVYDLSVPRGYALVIDDNYSGDLQFNYYTEGDTTSVSRIPLFNFYTPIGMVLGSDTAVDFDDEGVFVSELNKTVYFGSLSTAHGGRVLVTPYVSVTIQDNDFIRPLYNANLYNELSIGGYMTSVPYQALRLYPITQSHTNYNYVTIDTTRGISAVVNDQGVVVWDNPNIEDNNPPIPITPSEGFWSSLTELFTKGGDTLNGIVSSANGFFAALRSLFGWLPSELVTLIYTALTIIVVIGVVKVFL